jgi:RNA polymerase sigma-70 factor (ECF subfamily)
MFRATTFNELQRDRALGDDAAFVMDEEAFRDFYDRSARGLWAYLARVSGDRQLADDLLQETYYRFLRASARYESEAHRRNSLYRIATNLARDARRRRITRGFGNVTGDEIERIPSGHDGVAPERRAEFEQAMARLNPRERAMLWLAYAEGASHRDIAAILGLRTASLKAMLFRARRKVAALLGHQPAGARR